MSPDGSPLKACELTVCGGHRLGAERGLVSQWLSHLHGLGGGHAQPPGSVGLLAQCLVLLCAVGTVRGGAAEACFRP